jgi:hypothetical protein
VRTSRKRVGLRPSAPALEAAIAAGLSANSQGTTAWRGAAGAQIHVMSTKEADMLAAILIAPLLGAVGAIAAVWVMSQSPSRGSEPLGGILDVPACGARDGQPDDGEHDRDDYAVHQR